jgi:hypothetical protein
MYQRVCWLIQHLTGLIQTISAFWPTMAASWGELSRQKAEGEVPHAMRCPLYSRCVSPESCMQWSGLTWEGTSMGHSQIMRREEQLGFLTASATPLP